MTQSDRQPSSVRGITRGSEGGGRSIPATGGLASRPEVFKVRHGLVTTLGAAGTGGRGGKAVFPSVTLGRKPRVSITDSLEEIRVPDLVLRGRLDPKSLNEGLNTLTVVVSNGSSTDRLTQSVVFHWSPAAATKFTGGLFRPTLGTLPSRVDIGVDLLAPALRAVAGTGAAKRSARGSHLQVEKSTAPRHFRTREGLAKSAVVARERLMAAPEFTRALGRGEAERLRAGRQAIERGGADHSEASELRDSAMQETAERPPEAATSKPGRGKAEPPEEAS